MVATFILMSHSFGKIIYYFFLIIYHFVDVFLFWKAYNAIVAGEHFSGVPNSGSKAPGVLYLGSCISGSVLALLMILVYGYYIKYHRGFIGLRFRLRHDIDNRAIVLELVLTLLELFLKSGLQSSLIFCVYYYGDVECSSKLTVAYVLCNILGDFKQFLCFYTKLCGLGAGEDWGRSFLKGCSCSLGCLLALLFAFFSSLYLAKLLTFSSCPQL